MLHWRTAAGAGGGRQAAFPLPSSAACWLANRVPTSALCEAPHAAPSQPRHSRPPAFIAQDSVCFLTTSTFY
ncbi:hypothetical protein E2C01_041567 [Portunus trituberculatus]|uniref:Uncharacterized protein n=1 Tax=Portunus trituberculatus TaxID=210409 RepID=A0A5B7FJL0_PORTR|nr:hypothetical protein [Portunus trituberculatus]